ncbi:MAG: HAMP domain-containing histidine kinase [Caldilineaceae bacterium]|nr:HAMP domain-containing histidine kinase [Caldilineaceae bacterium]
MFRSIRWRLVFSFTALTLLTLTLVGLLTFQLIVRYIERQEIESLTANAEAIARQAQPYMGSRLMLTQLVRTASFLSDTQIRITTNDGRVLIDSGTVDQEETLLWYMPPEDLLSRWGDPGQLLSGIILSFGDSPGVDEIRGGLRIQHEDGSEITLRFAPITVERVPGMWGNRFHFNTRPSRQSPPNLADVEKTTANDKPGTFWQAFNIDALLEPAERVRSATVPIQQGAQVLGYVELSHDLNLTAGSLRPIRQAFVTAGIGVGLLAILVGLVVGQGLTSPIRTLGTAARRMRAGDLSARAHVRSADEIGDLAVQFNEMAAQLQTSFAELAAERDALRTFIADASHELRTPITALKTFVELLQGPAAKDPAAQAEFLAESQIQLERLNWITANLLDLSRLDAHLVDLDMEEHAAADLIHAAASPFRAGMRDRQIVLNLELGEEVTSIRCDRSRMELVLSNLLDNALKYTPDGGAVTIGAASAGTDTLLWVADTGDGIAPEDLPHIFERFYRGHSRRSQTEGSGLGLAIAESVIHAHGGRIDVQSVPGAGSRFEIRLPCAGDDNRENR